MNAKELHNKIDKVLNGEYVENRFVDYKIYNGSGFEIFDVYDKLKELFAKSIDDNYFWSLCSFTTYVNTFKNRFEDFNKKYHETTIIDFAEKEMDSISLLLIESFCEKIDAYIFLHDRRRCKYFRYYSGTDHFDINNRDGDFFYNLKIAFIRRIEFLKEIIKNGYNMDSHKTNNEPETFDYSDNKKTEKIIWLHELGVLEYLKNNFELGSSINQIASLVSSITGIDQATAQSYINPIFSKDVNQRNNPYNTKKNVDYVKNELNKMGYRIKKQSK